MIQICLGIILYKILRELWVGLSFLALSWLFASYMMLGFKYYIGFYNYSGGWYSINLFRRVDGESIIHSISCKVLVKPEIVKRLKIK